MEFQLKEQYKPLVMFLSITFSLSSIFYYLILDHGSMNAFLIIGLMWCPGISTFITLKILKRNFKELGWRWGKTKYQIQSFMIPVVVVIVMCLVVFVFGWSQILNDASILQNIILGFIPSMLFSLGEEIGWRGFLTPELYKLFGYTNSSLITGFIWGIWHLPIVFFADYNNGTPIWFAVSCFMIAVISISYVFTWLRIKSGSLWTAVILHTAHNEFIQGAFKPLTGANEEVAYYIGEFGIVLPIVIIGFGIYYWSRRKELTLVLAKSYN